MARYRVLHGKHQEYGVIYRKGEVVETDTDLLRLNAPSSPKFELLDGHGTTQSTAPQATAAFPGGQVSSGFQQTVGNPYTPSEPFTGPVLPEPTEAEKRAREHLKQVKQFGGLPPVAPAKTFK